MNKKITTYLYIVGVLWLGAAVQMLAFAGGKVGESIEAVLMEKNYEGQLSKEEFQSLTTQIFSEEKAETVQSIVKDGVFSAYGYSSQINNYIVSEGKKINLNVVSSYNEDSDMTKIIVASPIYNEDY